MHARSGAHGYFELTESLEQFTRAKILTEVGEKTEVFVRFSTVRAAPARSTRSRCRGLREILHQGRQGISSATTSGVLIQDAISSLISSSVKWKRSWLSATASAHDTSGTSSD